MTKLTNTIRAITRFIRVWGLGILLGLLFYSMFILTYADGYYDCKRSLLAEPEVVNYER